MHSVLSDQLYVCQAVDILPDGKGFRRFVPEESIIYFPLCDDFGPMNAASVIRFVRQLDAELQTYADCILIYCVEDGQRALTNAVFMLGCYMILRLNLAVEQVSRASGGSTGR